MTSETMQLEYRELVASGVSVPLLDKCLCAKLAQAAHTEFGRNDKAAFFLGVCPLTISRWNVAGRALPIREPLQATIGRLASALFDQELRRASGAPETGTPAAALAERTPYQRIYATFQVGLLQAALATTNGRKKAAATLLGVHRDFMFRYRKAVKTTEFIQEDRRTA